MGILLLPFLLLLTVQLKRVFIRHEVTSLLKQSQLQLITLKETDLIWEEVGKEIWVNGQLFDIETSYRSVNGMISFKGLFDEKETALHAQVENMLNGKQATLLLLAKIISLQSPTQLNFHHDQHQFGEAIQCSFLHFQQDIRSGTLKKQYHPPNYKV